MNSPADLARVIHDAYTHGISPSAINLDDALRTAEAVLAFLSFARDPSDSEPARVAVVRPSEVDPHPAMLRLVHVCRDWHDEYHVGAIFTLCSHQRCKNALDAATRVAVVRPTRDQIADVIFAARMAQDPSAAAADALLAEFWPGTPEGVELFVRCTRCNGRGEIELATGYDQCPECSSTLFVPFVPAGSPEEGNAGVAVSDSQETPE